MPTGNRAPHYVVTPADAIAAHEIALEAGGRPGVQNWDDLLSALGRPYHGYHRTMSRKAAALHEAVATSHGFVDGNKRTAILLTLLIIERSGYKLVPANDGETLERSIEEHTIAVVEHRLSFNEQVAWYKARIVRA